MGQAGLPPHRDREPGRADRPVEVLDQGQEAERHERRRLTGSPSKSPTALHRFCQFEFAFSPGPSDGRYLLRGAGDAADVIVVRSLGAPVKRAGRPSLGRRRASRIAAPPDEPEAVTVTQATVIRGESLESVSAAEEWLAACGDEDTANGEVEDAVLLLNRAIQAHRVSAGDPYAGDVSRAQARRVRVGYGTGEELVEGRWRDAYELPVASGRRRGRRMLAPEAQIAPILGGRRPVEPSEDLLLRARLDLDQGRIRQAALQARAARVALEAELADDEAFAEARQALEHRAAALEELAAAALTGELDDAKAARLAEAIAEMEKTARRRRHALPGG